MFVFCFVVKGQCDVLRLLDLSNCKNYIAHAAKYRMDRIQDDSPPTFRLNTEEIPLSSIVLREFPSVIMESSKAEPTPNSEKTLVSKRKKTSEPVVLEHASAKGILHSEKNKVKTKGHVSFRVVGENSSCPEGERRSVSEPLRSYNIVDEDVETHIDEGLIEERVDGDVGVGVFMMVDRLWPGQCFVSIDHLKSAYMSSIKKIIFHHIYFHVFHIFLNIPSSVRTQHSL